MKLLIFFAGLFLLYSFEKKQIAIQDAPVKTDTLQLLDKARNRSVPVVLYYAGKNNHSRLKLVVLSHGYGVPNTGYTYITTFLAQHGYAVACIQHDLPGDTPIPNTGNIMETRMPYWERGVQNILFVIQELKKTKPGWDYNNISLIGHSYGADIVMLLAKEHAAAVKKVIALDNRRMPFPRASQPQLFSLRSSDLPADEGVLPTAEEQKKYNIRIIPLPNTHHNDMDDHGTDAQKKEINDYLLQFLQSK